MEYEYYYINTQIPIYKKLPHDKPVVLDINSLDLNDKFIKIIQMDFKNIYIITSNTLTFLNTEIYKIIKDLPNTIFIFLLDDIINKQYLEFLNVKNSKRYYIDWYVDKNYLKLLQYFKKSDILSTLENLNIRICYTFENYSGNLNKKLFEIFKKYKNYYSFQNVITNRANASTCLPKAIKILKNGDIYTDCNLNKYLGNIESDINLKDILNITFNCSKIYCSSGDAINKENNYYNFYKEMFENIKEITNG